MADKISKRVLVLVSHLTFPFKKSRDWKNDAEKN